NSSGAIAAATAVVLLYVVWLGDVGRAHYAAGLAVTALVLTGATLAVGYATFRAYGAWIGIASATATALVLLSDRVVLRSIPRPDLLAAGTVAAAATLLVGLFLPWQTSCYENAEDFKAAGLAGRCLSSNGFGLPGSNAALLAILLAGVAALAPVLRE